MPRYLQKLVARAGLAPLPASLQPAFRSGADVGAPDSLREETEPSLPQSPARSERELRTSPATAPSSLAPPLPPIDVIGENNAPPPQVIRERTTERIFENRVEPQILLKASPPSAEMIRPPALHVEAPQQANLPRVESKLVPDMAHEDRPPVPVLTQPETKERLATHAQTAPLQTTAERPAEADVLSKLMPRLETWFNQPSADEKQAESHAPE